MTKKNELILVATGTIGLILFVLAIAFFTSKEEPQQAIDGWENLCYWKTIQPGQGITENGPGSYEYTLIMTTNGIDVYLPCNGESK